MLSCYRVSRKNDSFVNVGVLIILISKYRLCEGGELFFHITKKKHLSEAQASSIMK